MEAHEGTTTAGVQLRLDRLRAGDERAREELINVAYARLHVLARRWMGGVANRAGLESTGDLFQEASRRLWQALHDVTPNDARHFFALASQHTRYALLDMLRRRRPDVGVGGTGSLLSDPAAPLAEGDDIGSVLDCLGKLSDDLREVADLYIMQEFPRAVVAELLGVSDRQVNRLWTKARLMLQRCVEG